VNDIKLENNGLQSKIGKFHTHDDDRLRHLMNENLGLKERLVMAANGNEDRLKKYNHLEENTRLKGENSDLLRYIEELRAQIRRLEEENHLLKEHQKTWAEKNEILNSDNTKLFSDNKNFITKINEHKEEVIRLDSTLNTQNKRNEGLTHEISSLRQSHSSLEQNLTLVQRDLSGHHQKHSRLEQEHEHNKRESHTVKQRLSTIELAHSKLNETHTHQIRSSQQLQIEYENLKRECATVKARLDTESHNAAHYKSELNIYVAKWECEKNRASNYVADMNLLKKDLDCIQDDLQRLTSENLQLDSQVRDLTAENKRLSVVAGRRPSEIHTYHVDQEKVDEYERVIDGLRNDVHRLENRPAEVRVEVKDRVVEKTVVDTCEVDRLSALLCTTEDEVCSLKDRISSLERKLAAPRPSQTLTEIRRSSSRPVVSQPTHHHQVESTVVREPHTDVEYRSRTHTPVHRTSHGHTQHIKVETTHQPQMSTVVGHSHVVREQNNTNLTSHEKTQNHHHHEGALVGTHASGTRRVVQDPHTDVEYRSSTHTPVHRTSQGHTQHIKVETSHQPHTSSVVGNSHVIREQKNTNTTTHEMTQNQHHHHDHHEGALVGTHTTGTRRMVQGRSSRVHTANTSVEPRRTDSTGHVVLGRTSVADSSGHKVISRASEGVISGHGGVESGHMRIVSHPTETIRKSIDGKIIRTPAKPTTNTVTNSHEATHSHLNTHTHTNTNTLVHSEDTHNQLTSHTHPEATHRHTHIQPTTIHLHAGPTQTQLTSHAHPEATHTHSQTKTNTIMHSEATHNQVTSQTHPEATQAHTHVQPAMITRAAEVRADQPDFEHNHLGELDRLNVIITNLNFELRQTRAQLEELKSKPV
jgi:hypothetical protein